MNKSTIPKYAVIVVDLQQDFLTPGHFFDKLGKNLIVARQILPKVQTLINNLRQTSSVEIIWVHSVYGELEESLEKYQGNYFNATEELLAKVPLNNNLLSTTHEQKKENPCCARNSSGIQFCNEVIQVQDLKLDTFVQKQFYSAFRGTNLQTILREKAITNVAVCGVATDYCCQATSVDAYHLGFDVLLLKDCLQASTQEGHDIALQKVNTDAISVVSSEEFLKIIENDNQQNQ